MGADQLNELLGRMPEIAKAVNAFTSDAVQLAAFEALVGAQDVSAPGRTRGDSEGDASGDPPPPANRARKRATKAGTTAKSAKRKPAGNPKFDTELNLSPTGKKSFKDFVTEKAPSHNNDRSVVAVYYLANVLQLGAVTTDHVYTCYRDAGWKLPGQFRNHLQVIASRKHWINTGDGENILLTSSGLNHVEHDLPKPTKR